MGLHKNLTGDDLHIPQDHTHVEADITDFASADYLPLTAGSGQRLTGDLYVENGVAGAKVSLTDTGGDGYSYFLDEGHNFSLTKVTDTGDSTLRFDFSSGDGVSDYFIDMFSATSPTSGGGLFRVFVADASANIQHILDSTGDADLCREAGTIQQAGVNVALSTDLDSYLPLTAGSGEPLTGDLWVETSSLASVVIRADGAGADYGYVRHDGSSFAVAHLGSAASLLDLDPIPEGTSASTIRAFRAVNTSGARKFILYEGDGTSSVAHEFDAGTGNVKLCQLGGKLELEGPVQLPYLGAAPSGLTNGMIWMESDGLHLYYAGAEKVVAGV